MTLFSEEFPSLKDKIEWPMHVNIFEIQTSCVDKERLRDAIFLCTVGNTNVVDRLRLLKELNL